MTLLRRADIILKTPRKTPCLSPINTKTPIALLSDVLPAWLLNRDDFKRSLQEPKIIQKYDLRKLSPSPGLSSEIEKKVLAYHLSQFSLFKNLNKHKKKIFLQISKLSFFSFAQKIPLNRVHFLISGKGLLDNEIFIGPYNVIVENISMIKNIHDFKSLADTTTLSLDFEEYNELFLNFNLKNLADTKEKISKIEYFSGLSPNRLSELCLSLISLEYSKDTIVYNIGDPSRYFFVILSGKLELYSLLTLKTINRLPTGINQREELISKQKFSHVLNTVKEMNIFGHREPMNSQTRTSKAVVSENSKIIAIKWETAKEIFTELEKEKLSFNSKQFSDVNQKLRSKIKYSKVHFNALLEASEIKRGPCGRETFQELTKRKRLYVEALESNHNQFLKSHLLQFD